MMTKNLLTLLIISFSFVAQAQTSVMDYYRARIKSHREAMKKAGVDLTGAQDIIRTQDIKNGFIAYDLLAVEGYEEMAYFIPVNAPKFVAVVSFGCVPLCESGLPDFYELQNNQLTDRTERFMPAAMREQIEKGMESARKKIRITDKGADLSKWVKVPQKGTTIQIGFMEQGGENDTQIFHLVYEMTYNKNGGTFTLVEKLK